MKSDKIRRAIGGIDDELIEAADRRSPEKDKRTWIRWAASAAVFLVALTAVLGSTGLFRKGPAAVPGSSDAAPTESEYAREKKYVYHVDAGRFAAYVGGKVIAEDRLGKKLEDVTVTAGWTWSNPQNAYPGESEEHTKAEIYEIRGISPDVAAAVRFLEKMEAVTTDHYYVILNPEADLTAVRAYVIPSETEGEGPVPE